MGKFKIGFIPFSILIFIFFGLSFAQSQEKDLQEVKEVKEDIQIINLLNGLDLNKEQMEFIINKAQEAQAIRNEISSRINACKSEMVKTYAAIKEEVATGRVTVQEEEKKAHAKLKHDIEKMGNSLKEKTDALAQEIGAKLEQFQLIALDNYKACIVPIMTKGRIGQSDADTATVKILERVKTAPDAKYIRVKNKFLERLIDKVKEKAPPGFQIDEAKIRSDITEAFDKIRNMDDVDFQIDKTSIAQNLNDKIFPPQSPMSRNDKIKKFLLSENVMPILEDRLSKIQEDISGKAR
jgi:hypothetical protein